jgi:nucleoside-diphosphate kinase
MIDFKKERTFVILKPDAIQRLLMGDIIGRLEKTGLKLVAVKMTMATEDQLWSHYNKDDVWFEKKGQQTIDSKTAAGLPVTKEAKEYGKDIVRALVNIMTSGPVIPMIFEGNQAVAVVRKLVGDTEPLSSPAGTIRGDYSPESYSLANFDDRAVRNLIHCSDKPEEAEREIALWFKEEEIMKYQLLTEKMLYSNSLEEILK